MGMFDELICKYPLPYPEIQDALFQTKDTEAQFLDLYEIREDGTLWHEEYDCRVEFTDKAPFGMWEHHDNKRWVQVSEMNGELEIHHPQYSIRFRFRDGKVADLIPRKGWKP